jgi:hypothetical protein
MSRAYDIHFDEDYNNAFSNIVTFSKYLKFEFLLI